MSLDWSWFAFGVGVAVGLAVMWVAAVVSMAGDQSDRERDREEHWR